MSFFPQLNKAFQEEDSLAVIYCISMQWFREWEGFVKGKDVGMYSSFVGHFKRSVSLPRHC